MQQLSPRQYFETRLRKLPVYMCLVNEGWEAGKIAMVTVIRNHVNGKISGANFLVDLLCLGVKDVHCFFNIDEDEMMERLEEYNMHMIEIPYVLAHNIVYAGLEFAGEYHIKPHADFAMAKYALEEDDDAIELIDIETGENGIPHLMENYPGQYADAHGKLKKHAGEGNFKISQFMHDEDEDDWDEDEDVDFEDAENLEGGDDEDEDDEWDEEDDDEDFTVSINDIALGEITLYDTFLISDEELFDETLIDSREDHEQALLNIEKAIRLFEGLEDESATNASLQEEVDLINQKTEQDFAFPLEVPNGCQALLNEGELDELISLLETFQGLPTLEKSATLIHHFQKYENANPLFIAHSLFHLLLDEDGPFLYEKIHREIVPLRHIPLVALAQSFLVTSAPDRFSHPPFINTLSPSLSETMPEYKRFSEAEYCLFYALRCLEAVQPENLPVMIAWYRLLAETDKAESFLPMLITLQGKVINLLIEAMGKWEQK